MGRVETAIGTMRLTGWCESRRRPAVRLRAGRAPEDRAALQTRPISTPSSGSGRRCRCRRRLLEVIAVAGRPVQLRDAQTAALLPTLPRMSCQSKTARLVRTSDGRCTTRSKPSSIESAKASLLDSRPATVATTMRRSRRRSSAPAAPTRETTHFEGADDRERASRGHEQAAADAARRCSPSSAPGSSSAPPPTTRTRSRASSTSG